jgi:hypothetical protein
MAWSLLNLNTAMQVDDLLKPLDDNYGPEVERALPRDKALAVIHAAIWAYASREGSTASAYAFLNLMEALDIKAWSFHEEDMAVMSKLHMDRLASSPPSPSQQGE